MTTKKHKQFNAEKTTFYSYVFSIAMLQILCYALFLIKKLPEIERANFARKNSETDLFSAAGIS